MRALLLALLLVACAKETDRETENAGARLAPQGASAPPAAAAPARNLATWDEALAAGTSIAIEGEFMGNDRESKCAFAATSAARGPVKTSWDWLIRKDGRCMWVTRGADPRGYNRVFGAPEAILDRASVGRRVAVTATVAADQTGRFYLTYTDGRALD